MAAELKFTGRAYINRGVWFHGRAYAKGDVIACNESDFTLLAESGRAEPFDPKNDVHVEALKKQEAAAKKAAKDAEDKK